MRHLNTYKPTHTKNQREESVVERGNHLRRFDICMCKESKRMISVEMKFEGCDLPHSLPRMCVSLMFQSESSEFLRLFFIVVAFLPARAHLQKIYNNIRKMFILQVGTYRKYFQFGGGMIVIERACERTSVYLFLHQ